MGCQKAYTNKCVLTDAQLDVCWNICRTNLILSTNGVHRVNRVNKDDRFHRVNSVNRVNTYVMFFHVF